MSAYKIRNQYHEVLGTYTEKEVLKRIQRGKYTGQEEVSTPPHRRWQKLASHPKFYDAFVKRIYSDEYKAPPGEPSKPGKVERVHKTRHRDGGKTRVTGNKEAAEDRPEKGNTEQRKAEKKEGGGLTLHQSIIDELFSKEKSQPKKEEVAPLELELPLDAPEIALEKGLDINAGPTEEESPEVVKKRKDRERRRKLVFASVTALAFALLFRMGQGDGVPKFLTESNNNSDEDFSGEKGGNAEKAKSLLVEAIDLYGSDSPLALKEANLVLRDALSLDSTNAVTVGRLALNQSRRLLYDPPPEFLSESDVQQWIQNGRQLDPQHTLFYQAEALLALARKQVDEAIKYAIAAVEADPGGAEPLFLLAEMKSHKGDFAGARRDLDEAFKTSVMGLRARHLSAKLAFEERNYLKAKAESFEALKLNPFHQGSFMVLADSAAARNEFKEAKSYYETAGRLAKLGSKAVAGRAYDRLSQLQLLTGDAVRAGQNAQLAFYYGGNSDGLKDRLAGLDLTSSKLKLLADAAEFNEAYLEMQSESLAKEGKLVEAIKFRQAAQWLSPDDGISLVKLGELLEKRAASYAEFRRVIHLYERAMKRNSKLAEAYVRLGLLETDQYNLDRGYRLLSRAMELAPEDASVYVAMGKHYYRRQDYNEALNQFLTAAKLNPADSEILYYAGLLRIMFKKDSARDAMRFFYQAYTLNPQNYESLVQWLRLKVENHEKAFAIKFLRSLMDHEPNNPNLHWAYGEIYSANSEHYRAISYFHKALDLDNRSSKVRMSLGKSLETVGDIEKAVAEYRLASMLDPRNGDGSYRAAKLLVQAKMYNQAEEVLRGLINITPNYPGAHRELAMVYRARRQEGPALAAMEREVSNNPRNARFVIELAELYMEYQKQDRALAELSKIANLPPVTQAPEYVYDKIRAYLLMSRAYRAQKKFDIAEGTIKLGLEIDPDDPELHKELGYVYHGLQRDKEAVKAFEFYLGRNPAAEDAIAIKGIINSIRID